MNKIEEDLKNIVGRITWKATEELMGMICIEDGRVLDYSKLPVTYQMRIFEHMEKHPHSILSKNHIEGMKFRRV